MGACQLRRDTPILCPTLQLLDISTLGDTVDVNPLIKFLPHTLPVCGRNLITGLTSAASPRVDILGRTEIWSVSPSVDMLPFGVTIPATVARSSEIQEGLMNYPVLHIHIRAETGGWKRHGDQLL